MLPQCLLLTVSTKLLICRLLHLPQVLPLGRGLNPFSRHGAAHAKSLACRELTLQTHNTIKILTFTNTCDILTEISGEAFKPDLVGDGKGARKRMP